MLAQLKNIRGAGVNRVVNKLKHRMIIIEAVKAMIHMQLRVRKAEVHVNYWLDTSDQHCLEQVTENERTSAYCNVGRSPTRLQLLTVAGGCGRDDAKSTLGAPMDSNTYFGIGGQLPFKCLHRASHRNLRNTTRKRNAKASALLSARNGRGMSRNMFGDVW
jgi:hypothetical protein